MSAESHVNLTSLEAYDFPLRDELIAQRPVEPRDSSRLMVIDRKTGKWEHKRFTDLPGYFDAKDLLIANNTRVIKARLQGQRIREENGQEVRGGKVEMLLLEEVRPLVWEGAFHSAARAKPGVRFEVPTPDGKGLNGVIVRGSYESDHGTIEVQFDRDPVACGAGVIPLPHYIDRDANAADEAEYQTMYAKQGSSAAAPTAGLHFTPRVMDGLRERGAAWDEVTLNVGLGTFRPVKTSDIREHLMHEERYQVSSEVAALVTEGKREGQRITAVGTTAVRTLESAWDPEMREVRPGTSRTSIFIYPGGREIQVVDRLITNFHLPKSTLLMLVCAFGGRELILEAYNEALRENYRFFSYGDAMLVL
jgi:S-adenosylmethionine:tRNA ribosyltransferase-isomerase